MKRLFKDRMRRQTFYLVSFLLWSFLLSLGAAFIYTPPLEGRLSLVESMKNRAPEISQILGIRQGLTPTGHFVSMACGLCLPLLSFLYVFYAVKRLQAEIILKKEYYFFIQTHNKQSDIVMVNFLAISFGFLLQFAVILSALATASLIWDYWKISFGSVTAALLTMLSADIFTLGWLLLGTSFSKTGKIHFLFPFLTALWFLLPRAAALTDKIEFIKYLSPFFASDVWEALNHINISAILICFSVGVAFAFAAALYFNRREFVKEEDQP